MNRYRIEKGTELTNEKLAEFLTKAREENVERYERLEAAYRTDYAIFYRAPKPNYKPDNRLAVNLARYIVDTFNGFFIGHPVKTTTDDEKAAKVVEYVENYNNQDDNNSELAKLMSIYGKAYELYYVDASGQLAITFLPPTEAFMVYDDDLVPSPVYFVYFYKDADDVEVGAVYDATTVRTFKRPAGTDFQFSEPVPHYFQGVPATQFDENREQMGLFEPVMSLLDAYNSAISEKANDVDYFGDAYLVVTGGELGEKDLISIRDRRTINIPGSYNGDTAQVYFLTKPDADGTQEHLLDRLERLIYQVAMVPNINDESFGTASGIAMQYKLLNTRNLFAIKQRKFAAGMLRRWKLLFSHPTINAQAPADGWVSLRFRFTPNLPENILEEAQTAQALTGITSHRTQLELISCVDNVDAEEERIRQEQEEQLQEPDWNGHDHSHGQELTDDSGAA